MMPAIVAHRSVVGSTGCFHARESAAISGSQDRCALHIGCRTHTHCRTFSSALGTQLQTYLGGLALLAPANSSSQREIAMYKHASECRTPPGIRWEMGAWPCAVHASPDPCDSTPYGPEARHKASPDTVRARCRAHGIRAGKRTHGALPDSAVPPWCMAAWHGTRPPPGCGRGTPPSTSHIRSGRYTSARWRGRLHLPLALFAPLTA